MGAAAVAYLVESATRALAPQAVPVVQPLYAGALAGELLLALWLLRGARGHHAIGAGPRT